MGFIETITPVERVTIELKFVQAKEIKNTAQTAQKQKTFLCYRMFEKVIIVVFEEKAFFYNHLPNFNIDDILKIKESKQKPD